MTVRLDPYILDITKEDVEQATYDREEYYDMRAALDVIATPVNADGDWTDPGDSDEWVLVSDEEWSVDELLIYLDNVLRGWDCTGESYALLHAAGLAQPCARSDCEQHYDIAPIPADLVVF